MKANSASDMMSRCGTCVTPYESDTAGTIAKVTDGTVTVEISGDVYTITLESSNINAQYIGSLTL